MHMLEGLPETVQDFGVFYDNRRAALRVRISQILIASSDASGDSVEPQRVPAA
jgi:hypothetical protein